MDEQLFIQTINAKAKQIGINPLLLISGIEGLYSFREVELTAINYEFLDSLILTIFALRIGDQFHNIAEENFRSSIYDTMQAAAAELRVLNGAEIDASSNEYLRSFSKILNGKSNIRVYHIKALDVSAIEIRKAQLLFENNSIGAIILDISKKYLNDIELGSLFSG